MEKHFAIYTNDSKCLRVIGEQLPTESGIIIRKRNGELLVVPGHNYSYMEIKEVPILGEA